MPLSLEAATELALRRDPNLDRSCRSLEMAEIGVQNARSAYFPSLSVGISASQSATGSAYRAESTSFRRGLRGSFVGSISANASVPVDVSGTIGRQVAAARLQEKIARLSLKDAERDAVLDIMVAYWKASEAQRRVAIDHSITRFLQNLLETATERLPNVVSFLELELANAREMERNSRGSAERAEDALKLALRLPFDLQLHLTTDIPEASSLQDAIAAASSRTIPDLELERTRLDAAEMGALQARDSRRSSLRVGAYATQSFSGRFVDELGRTRTRDFGLNLSWSLPILSYDAGRSENSVRMAELRVEQASLDLEMAERRRHLLVRQARKSVERALERLHELPDPDAAKQALESAAAALIGSDQGGAAAVLPQVSNARASWRAAQLSVLSASVEYVLAELQLARLDGREITPSRFAADWLLLYSGSVSHSGRC